MRCSRGSSLPRVGFLNSSMCASYQRGPGLMIGRLLFTEMARPVGEVTSFVIPLGMCYVFHLMIGHFFFLTEMARPAVGFVTSFTSFCFILSFRDGTTRRWMCHGFMALRESGERLSHAVGCAFALCLERKLKRDKDCGVTANFAQDKTSFER